MLFWFDFKFGIILIQRELVGVDVEFVISAESHSSAFRQPGIQSISLTQLCIQTAKDTVHQLDTALHSDSQGYSPSAWHSFAFRQPGIQSISLTQLCIQTARDTVHQLLLSAGHSHSCHHSDHSAALHWCLCISMLSPAVWPSLIRRWSGHGVWPFSHFHFIRKWTWCPCLAFFHQKVDMVSVFGLFSSEGGHGVCVWPFFIRRWTWCLHLAFFHQKVDMMSVFGLFSSEGGHDVCV